MWSNKTCRWGPYCMNEFKRGADLRKEFLIWKKKLARKWERQGILKIFHKSICHKSAKTVSVLSLWVTHPGPWPNTGSPLCQATGLPRLHSHKSPIPSSHRKFSLFFETMLKFLFNGKMFMKYWPMWNLAIVDIHIHFLFKKQNKNITIWKII